jgi:hypothetical protein
MKKLAIFGDSFAELFSAPGSDLMQILGPGKYRSAIDNRKEFRDSYLREMPTWYRLLGQDLEYDTVHTFGRGGTDIVWSYLQFLKYHQEYDTVIFVATHDMRHTHIKDRHDIADNWHGPASFYDSTFQRTNFMQGVPINCTSAEQCEHWLARYKKEQPQNFQVHNLLKTYIDYHTHVYSNYPYRDKLIWASLCQQMISIRPNIKMINAFKFGFNDHNINIPKGKLQELYEAENMIMAGNKEQIRPNFLVKSDARIGHLTTETHHILNKLMKPWLKSKDTWFDFDLETVVKEIENSRIDEKRYNSSEHKDLLDWAKYCKIHWGPDFSVLPFEGLMKV